MIEETSSRSWLHRAILAGLGTAGAACSGGQSGGPHTDVELPPSPSATQTVAGEPRPPRDLRGYVKEPNGSLHRASAIACDTTIQGSACRGDEGHLSCRTDADCKAGPNGRCMSGTGQIGAYCGCEYACEIDADCGDGQACVCATEANERHSVCAEATCKSDADCPSGACGVSRLFNGCGNEVRLACRTGEDACRSDEDCGGDGLRSQCAVRGGKWGCYGMTCAIGRPFLVGEVARLAPLTGGDAWSSDAMFAALEAGAAALSPDERAARAAAMREQARLEHASVASFARASLELLALGAPPDLLADTARAMRDEVFHARACFTVARAYGADVVSPGRLDLGGALAPDVDVERVAYAVAFEGCVGETLGAAEAEAATRDAADPALAEILARIASDECAHATLAWRTLAWLVAAHGAAARDAARRGLDAGLAAMAGGGAGTLHRDTARLVVEPLAARCLGARVTPPAA